MADRPVAAPRAAFARAIALAEGKQAARSAEGATASMLRFGDCELDFARRELRRAGALLELQPTPLRVLLYLAEHRDRTVPRRELLDAVWPDVVVSDESLTRALAEIRRALESANGGEPIVRTFKRAGVRFVARAEEDSAAPLAPSPRRRARLALGAAAALVAVAIVAALALRPEPIVPFGVAVLPVANFTGDAASQPLADGLTEQITHALSENGYPVVARTTSAQWRERAADVRELGERLGVSHVLEGSVRRAGDRVRVTLQLVASDTGKHVWSEVFERPATSDLFALQDEVTDRVAVRVYHYVWEDAVALREDPALARSSELVVATRAAFLDNRYDELFAKSEELLAALPEREPYLQWRAETHARLSDAWTMLYRFVGRPFAEAAPQILSHAEAAVAATPNSHHAHAALARALLHHWRWSEAEREVRRVCELAPLGVQCDATRMELCSALGCVAEWVEGAAAWTRKSPAEFGAWANLAVALTFQSQVEEAEAHQRRAEALDPPPGALPLAPSLAWRMSRREEAVAVAAELLAARGAPEAGRELESIGARSPEQAWRWLAEQQAAKANGAAWPNQNDFEAARTYAELGDFESSLAALERSVAEREVGMELSGLDPIFDPIRETPRFRALIETMGLTAYHAKYAQRGRLEPPIAAPSAPLRERAPLLRAKRGIGDRITDAATSAARRARHAWRLRGRAWLSASAA
jgi:TolB-like protein/tetratricopeptide (TPR) repeat protein